MAKTIFLVLCFVCSTAEIFWVQILSLWVFILLLCVYCWKNMPQSKLWLQQCLQAECQIQVMWARWLNICREICHLRCFMSKDYPMNIHLKESLCCRPPNRKTQIKKGFCPRSSFCDLQHLFFNFLWTMKYLNYPSVWTCWKACLEKSSVGTCQ